MLSWFGFSSTEVSPIHLRPSVTWRSIVERTFNSRAGQIFIWISAWSLSCIQFNLPEHWFSYLSNLKWEPWPQSQVVMRKWNLAWSSAWFSSHQTHNPKKSQIFAPVKRGLSSLFRISYHVLFRNQGELKIHFNICMFHVCTHRHTHIFKRDPDATSQNVITCLVSLAI